MSTKEQLNPSRVEGKIRRTLASLNGFLVQNNLVLTDDSRKLKAMKDIHKGKHAFLIGNGPSVQVQDLEQLQDGIYFVCNRFNMAYNLTSFRPTYTLASDRQTISDFGQEIVTNAESEVIIASLIKPDFTGDFTWLSHQNKGYFESIYRGVVPGGGTLIVAIQLAWHMGIRNFTLYGVDHNYPNMNKTESSDIFYSASGEGNHFISNYRSGKPWCPPIVEAIEESFLVCKNFIEKNGGSIVNATRGGKLELFERRAIESYFKSEV